MVGKPRHAADGETEVGSRGQAQVGNRARARLTLSQLARPSQATPPDPSATPQSPRRGEGSPVAGARTHHVHDLQEAEGEVDGERLRVVGHGPLQGVVVLDQLLVELPLELALQGHLRRGEPSGLLREGHRGCTPRPLPADPHRPKQAPQTKGALIPRTAPGSAAHCPSLARAPKPGPGAGRTEQAGCARDPAEEE